MILRYSVQSGGTLVKDRATQSESVHLQRWEAYTDRTWNQSDTSLCTRFHKLSDVAAGRSLVERLWHLPSHTQYVDRHRRMSGIVRCGPLLMAFLNKDRASLARSP